MTLDGSRDSWRTPQVDDLCSAFECLETPDEIGAFLRDLCTAAEIEAMAHRLAAARLLDRGLPYHQVAERVGGSTTTVTRVAQWLRRGEGWYSAGANSEPGNGRAPRTPAASTRTRHRKGPRGFTAVASYRQPG